MDVMKTGEGTPSDGEKMYIWAGAIKSSMATMIKPSITYKPIFRSPLCRSNTT